MLEYTRPIEAALELIELQLSEDASNCKVDPAKTSYASVGFAVIVPVYNEAAVLERFLRLIRDGLPPDAQVVVALNGCTDASATIVASVSDARIRTVETVRPGKARGIRAAEAITDRFPRFYVDADVEIRGSDLSRLAARLATSNAMMISPRAAFRYEGATCFAKAFNDVWIASNYIRNGAFQYVIGLSEKGRACWGEMPDVLADDTFMRLSVPPEERIIADEIQIIVRLPTRWRPIIRVRRRIALGLRQLRSLGYQPREAVAPSGPTIVGSQPWPKVAIYILGVMIGRIWAYTTPLRTYEWGKDQSSRAH